MTRTSESIGAMGLTITSTVFADLPESRSAPTDLPDEAKNKCTDETLGAVTYT